MKKMECCEYGTRLLVKFVQFFNQNVEQIEEPKILVSGLQILKCHQTLSKWCLLLAICDDKLEPQRPNEVLVYFLRVLKFYYTKNIKLLWQFVHKLLPCTCYFEIYNRRPQAPDFQFFKISINGVPFPVLAGMVLHN